MPGQVMGASMLLPFGLLGSFAGGGLFGSETQLIPSTKNLYWTGWFHGTETVTVHTFPTCTIASPAIQAPVL